MSWIAYGTVWSVYLLITSAVIIAANTNVVGRTRTMENGDLETRYRIDLSATRVLLALAGNLPVYPVLDMLLRRIW